MKRISIHLRIALYNIWHNKAYAAFCILGTALTFVFIILLLQFVHVIISDEPPLTYADRTITIPSELLDKNGDELNISLMGIVQLRQLVKDYEAVSLAHHESANVFVNGRMKSVIVNFVNDAYWDVKNFNFVEGRSFVKEDHAGPEPVAVIKESLAKRYFGKNSAVGKQFELQGITYTIIGVVEDFSVLTDEWAGIWVSFRYNKYVPSGDPTYQIDYLFPADMPQAQMKSNVSQALSFYFQQQNKQADISPEKLSTAKTSRIDNFGGNVLLYGAGLIVSLLLIIPAVNIVTLSVANVSTRSEEIAVRRALGATKASSFMQIIVENLILVFFGTVLGLLLTYPVIGLIETQLLDATNGEGVSLLGSLNYWVVLIGVLPLSVLFSLLSGGIPAYLVVKRNIADTLKGGSKQ